ncbi:MAG TPA: sugar ABC transporter permease [Thermomicrobiales bacterium]
MVSTTARAGDRGAFERPTPRLSRRSKRTLTILALLAPAVGLRLFTAVYPYVQAIQLSFYDYNPAFPPKRWVGLGNYERALDDVVIRTSISFTILFVVASTVLQIVLGLGVALLLNRAFFGRGLVRAINLIPWAIPMVVVAVGFRWMLDPQYGIFNDLLDRTLGVNIAWLIKYWPSRIAVIGTNVWKSTPFLAIVFLAALQAIPQDTIEASRVDGANRVQSFFGITLPLLMPQVVVIGLFMLVWQLASFDLIFAMTGGGPGYATQVLAYSIYQVAFTGLNYGYASAVSMILFAVVAVTSAVMLFIFRRVEVTL